MGSAQQDAWRRSGRHVEVGGHRIFRTERGDGEPAVVIVHGYPGSSYDFADVIGRLGRRVLAMDLLGFGFSDKPRAASYSLFRQADIVTQLVADAEIESCVLVGHDMGTSVVAELLARSNAGALPVAVEQAFLLNGSIFLELAQLTRGQRFAMRWHGRAMPVGMPRAFLRRSIAESIAAGTAVSAEALEDLVDLVRRDGGDRLLTRIIDYQRERREHEDVWTAAFVNIPRSADGDLGRPRPDRRSRHGRQADRAAPGHRRRPTRRRRALALDRGAAARGGGDRTPVAVIAPALANGGRNA